MTETPQHPSTPQTVQPQPAPAQAAPTEQPEQRHIVPGEQDGYRAPGGSVRMSTRDKIAAARRYSAETVDVPEWDTQIEVRTLALGVRNEMMEKVMDEDGEADLKSLYPEMLIASCYDVETGEPVFAEDDAAFINDLDAAAVDKVAEVALKKSGMKEKAEEEAAGKSSETATSVSPS